MILYYEIKGHIFTAKEKARAKRRYDKARAGTCPDGEYCVMNPSMTGCECSAEIDL